MSRYLCPKCDKRPLNNLNDLIKLSNSVITKAANKLCELLKVKISELNEIYEKVSNFISMDDDDELSGDDFNLVTMKAVKEI